MYFPVVYCDDYFTAKMLHKLIVESNQKIEISIYQERIREMEQHIGDIENLYAGIRGMKHDMKIISRIWRH